MKIAHLLIAFSILLTIASCNKTCNDCNRPLTGLVTINSGHADSTNFIITDGLINYNAGNTGYSTTINSADTFFIFIVGQLRNGINTLNAATLSVNISINSGAKSVNNSIQGSTNPVDSAFANNTGTIQMSDSTLTFNLQITAGYPFNTYPFTGTVKY